MKATTAVLAVLLMVAVVLWWRMTGRAGSPVALPEVPVPPGTAVVRRLYPLVNLRTTFITVAETPLRPTEVDRFYRNKLLGLGWVERLQSAPEGQRRPLSFRKGGWDVTVFAFPASPSGATHLLIHERRATDRPSPGRLPRRRVSVRLGGFPLYPGVEGALLIESGGAATILYETDAPLLKVAEFYRRRLDSGQKQFAELGENANWASGGFTYRGQRVVVNLSRRAAGKTSALVIINRRESPTVEVKAWSGAATF